MNLAEIYEASRLRVQKQRVLEDYIEKFNPTYMEVRELLDSLKAALRYQHAELGVELEDAFMALEHQLEEAERTEQGEGYDEMTQAKWAKVVSDERQS